MATFDAHKNFAISTVAVAPVSPTGGTSLSVFAGDGTKFPAVPFNAVIWPVNTQPVTANAEIVRVTNISGDVFTLTRNSETGGTSRSVIVGDQIGANMTAKLLTDIEALFPVGAVVGTTDAQVLTNKTLTSPTINTPTISAPVLSGTATGTYTLAGTPTITAPAISSPVLSGTATGTYTLSGSPTINSHVVSGDITGTYNLKGSAGVFNVVVSSATGTQNDFAPGLIGNTVLRMNNATLTTITGFAGGYTGQRLIVLNVGAGQVDFVYNSASSIVNNKLVLPMSTMNTSLGSAGQGAAEFVYDGSARWLMVSHEQGGAISWTPTITFGGAATGVTYAGQTGSYYVKGRNLSYSGTLTLSSKGSSVGTAVIGGLPSASTTFYGLTVFPGWASMVGIPNVVIGQLNPGIPAITLITGGAVNTAFITDANLTNNTALLFSGSYPVT